MNKVTDQYDAYPYPAREPQEEKKRLLQGSPSLPAEIDHFVYDGQRDWSKTLRVLVAGGGTGDGLIQLAQNMTSANRPYEIVYLDLSSSARKIAEERAKVRGLAGIRFETGSILDASEYGTFDYIDCCGVLHHLPDPEAGFLALGRALKPGGGMGIMVYAPHGRSGVYPLQAGFDALFGNLTPSEKLAAARHVFKTIPADHPFKRNRRVVDHEQSDAGFYDLLLHSQDRAFSVTELLGTLERSGLDLISFVQPALYDLSRFCSVPQGISQNQQMAICEQLRGTMKVHVCYVAHVASGKAPASGKRMSAIPHLNGIGAQQLAQGLAKGMKPSMTVDGEKIALDLPQKASGLIAGINGKRTLAEIARSNGRDPIGFASLWGQVDAELRGWGKLHYSSFLK